MTAREVALGVLERAEREDRFIDNVLDQVLLENLLDERDTRLVQEIVYGVTKLRKHLDFIIDHLRDKRRPRGFLRNILRMGVYQILFTDRVPDYAAIDESVKLATSRGPHAAGFVNALLRRVVRERVGVVFPDRLEKPVDYLSVFYSHPEWLLRRWMERYGREATERLCKVNNEPPPLSIRTNTCRISSKNLVRRLQDEGMQVRIGRYRDYLLQIDAGPPLATSPSFRQGFFQVQDESAAFVSELLNPKPGERIVDMCASPGGKTTHLAQLMKDDGLVLAVDISAKRLKPLLQNVERLAMHSILPVVADSRSFSARDCDGVLLDVPCSGSGTLRRRADLRWRRQENDMGPLTQLQMELLENGASLLGVGGRLVYSTCSIEPDENEAIVTRFLKKHPDFALQPVPKQFPPELVKENHYLQTLPHEHGIDGTFACLLRKTREK